MRRAREWSLDRFAMWIAAALLVSVATGVIANDDEWTIPQAKVGLPARIEGVILPGSELEAVPWDDRQASLVVRIENLYRHGDAYRYDLVYTGFEPGRYLLREYLKRKDGSPLGGLPPLPVEVVSVLPAEGHVVPHELAAAEAPRLGGYRALLVAAGVVWLVGLILLLAVRRRRKMQTTGSLARPLTLAERLRPIVHEALAGRLTSEQRAELERLLLNYWRERLELQDMKADEAMARLRAHDEAGAVLRQLELWLHHPSAAEQVDVDALLRPYENLPAGASDRQPAGSGAR